MHGNKHTFVLYRPFQPRNDTQRHYFSSIKEKPIPSVFCSKLKMISFDPVNECAREYGSHYDHMKVEEQKMETESDYRSQSTASSLLDMEEGMDSTRKQRIAREIHLANHFLNWLRGPFRMIIDAPIRIVEIYTRRIHVNDTIVQAVRQGLVSQKQNVMDTPAFASITADWTYEGKNADRGFSSTSVWMRDPSGRRILVKTQDHPMCAANEWLAFVFGQALGLPVNEVQIAIYQNKLVTLHTDVANEHGKATTFINLSKDRRHLLAADPVMVRMDLFDHIVENVDRNPRNILITMSNAHTRDHGTQRQKIHLIDHSSCFGMGKLSIVSLMACKLQSQHLVILKFDPADRAAKFDQYLRELPMTDRVLIRRTLKRFAAVTNDQLDSWMDQIRSLLSLSQHRRILDVLSRQRDVAGRYTLRWSNGCRYSAKKLNPRVSHKDEKVVYF